jgi:hypothetical protein
MIGPPAPTAVQFDSPVPLLLEGVSAEITNMWISPLAYTEDKIESKMLVVWSEVVINNEKQVIPISAMTKQTEDSSWQVHSLLPDDTQVSNISFSLYDGKFQFNCTTSPNGEGIIDNGNTLQMNCKIQPSSQ